MPIRSHSLVYMPETGRHGVPSRMLCGLAASMALMALMVLMAASAANVAGLQTAAAPGDAAAFQDAIDFDIPAQPLAAALNRYAAISRKPALFSTEMAAGRVSSPVHGRYTPALALQRLLEGTGIAAERIESGPADAFVLKEIEASPVAPDALPAGGYPGLVQAGVWRALCSDARTAPGAYRSLLRFQIDAAGRLHDPRLLGSTGDARRDAALLEILRQIRIDAPPPAIAQQMLTMIVLPAGEGGPSCNPQAGEAQR